MATYAIGDIQGCFGPFRRLLERVAFDPDADRLWIAGDLVNRGPGSAEVLRWCRAHEACVQAVLGNHDLHLLMRAHGLRPAKGRDTLEDVLDGPDRAELLDYVLRQPFLRREGDRVLVHAGLHPRWSVEEAERRARRLEGSLRAEGHPLLSVLAVDGESDLAKDAAVFTRMRTVGADGEPSWGYTGSLDDLPEGELPWFDHPARNSREVTVICGHWAALGLHRGPGVLALDSGCVWGQALTAVRLDDDATFQVPCRD